ncbi:iron chelate uptake ABC transporter family permease subunit [Anaerococcus porci]|uniref:Iron chelate uptake ABC transporter family permease subunit n=1 Tax=Anaerococcus porci TaxID=2652269 RepID=A0A6N7VFR1_9FIRM|nr:iron chelate uptake ABC transporter family permease subunit [Anaerococcus porci]MDY3006820.1 iron chelate uptake ABC transporter family permease subunit [Anaerococcus porci]MSS78275.1 iron chelate uptake ABC transporter family permease subunit [Anaerococcus porci]
MYNIIRSSFKSKKDFKNYMLILTFMVIISILLSFLLLNYNNPVPMDSSSYKIIVKNRMNTIIAITIASVCQALSTISFQSITNNRVITPSLLGFEAVYSTIHTAMMFFFGVSAFLAFRDVSSFVLQIAIMVVLCLLLYGFMLNGKYANIHYMLLIGVVIGTGLRSLSAFMRRILSPSEFDILQAKLFASVSKSDPSYFKIAIPIVLISSLILFLYANKLNVLSLGKDIAVNLGLNYKRLANLILILVSILMSVSTALVGPMTFFGFLSASITYEICKSFDHKYLFIMAILLAFSILSLSYFLMFHVFSAQGVVTIIIELFGGLLFLSVILRKESL